MTRSLDPNLQPTPMLDFHHPDIRQLVAEKDWQSLPPYEAIGAVYDFVRDEIAFGYNRDDTLSASEVLADGYGQCNTKGTLLMALLRAVGIPTRFHGFTIYNALQKGAIPLYLFPFAPARIIHSWVEVNLEGKWLNLEGYIIDTRYLNQIQKRYGTEQKAFSAYGIATRNLSQPEVIWQGRDTYIQSEGIADDLGVYDQPDDFYREKGSNLSGLRRFLFRYVFRHLMNRNVNNIRNRGIRKGLAPKQICMAGNR